MFAHIAYLPNRGDSQVVQKGVGTCAWMDRKVVMVMFSNAQILLAMLVHNS